jgi:hypothetical protein
VDKNNALRGPATYCKDTGFFPSDDRLPRVVSLHGRTSAGALTKEETPALAVDAGSVASY